MKKRFFGHPKSRTKSGFPTLALLAAKEIRFTKAFFNSYVFFTDQHGEEAAALGKELALILQRIGACRYALKGTISRAFI
jgi:hypothetical protein